MKQTIKLSYELSYDRPNSAIEGVSPQKVEYTIDASEATLDELVQHFERFVKAIGYFPRGSIEVVEPAAVDQKIYRQEDL